MSLFFLKLRNHINKPFCKTSVSYKYKLKDTSTEEIIVQIFKLSYVPKFYATLSVNWANI